MYRNDLDGTFTEVRARAGTEAAVGGVQGAVAFGDFDDDDDLELVVSGASATRLFDNQRSGIFMDVTEERGVTPGGAGVVRIPKSTIRDSPRPDRFRRQSAIVHSPIAPTHGPKSPFGSR